MIYVFGKNGFVGSNLIPYLEEHGHEVQGVGRSDKMPTFSADDCVINAACTGWARGDREDKWLMMESNALLPLEIASKLNGANMVHLAASSEWQEPELAYSRTKAIASKWLKGKAHVCYIYTIFGGKNPNMQRFMDPFIKAVKEGTRFRIWEPLACRDWVHIRNICSGIEALLTSREHKEYHFATGHMSSLATVYGIAQGITGKALENITIEDSHEGTIWKRCEEPMFTDTLIEDMRAEICG